LCTVPVTVFVGVVPQLDPEHPLVGGVPGPEDEEIEDGDLPVAPELPAGADPRVICAPVTPPPLTDDLPA
jgi:hypothetical protein